MSGWLSKKPEGYEELLDELVAEVRQARVRAGVAVNRELMGPCWRVGRAVLE